MSIGLELEKDKKYKDPGIKCGPGLTKQSFTDECDVNKIVARFEKTGMINNLSRTEPFYGDVSEFTDLQSALDKVNSANELFMSMSAEIRKRFDNDPIKMVQFLSDSNNKAEAVALGMVIPEPMAAVEPPKTPEAVNP